MAGTIPRQSPPSLRRQVRLTLVRPQQNISSRRQKVIQIHPSLRCNLSCRHCYSSSGPGATAQLDEHVLVDALSDAAEMGYEVASFSGGEPLLYPSLERLLVHARDCGLRTAVTTNATILGHNEIRALSNAVDVVAVSVDGPPELHNRIRGSPVAFDRMHRGLDILRGEGIPFGIIHTLTAPSWIHLPWLIDFAREEYAKLLQLHPLEMTGRAMQQMTDAALDQEALCRSYLIAAVAGQTHPGLTIQFDAYHVDHLREHPDIIYAQSGDEGSVLEKENAAEALRVMVVEANGNVVPVSSGFDPAYAIGSLHEERMRDAWANYAIDGYPRFRSLCRRVFDDLMGDDELALVNWNASVTRASHEPHPDNDSPGKIVSRVGQRVHDGT